MEKSQTRSAESLLEENTRLIKLSAETLQNKPYLKRWADKKNLQTASEIYTRIKQAGYDSLEDALEHLSKTKKISKDAHLRATELDKEMRSIAKIISYAEQYQANLPYKRRYEKTKDPEGYFKRHETEISLCDGAYYMLKRENVDPDKISPAALRSTYSELKARKQAVLEEYNSRTAYIKELEKLTATLESYLEREEHDITRRRSEDVLA